jgi:hypothetical protein
MDLSPAAPAFQHWGIRMTAPAGPNPAPAASPDPLVGSLLSHFRVLEWAFGQRDPMVIYRRVHPRLDPLRADPRFDDLVHRVGLVP